MGSSLTGVSLGVSVGLGCFCLEACVYSGVLEFVLGKPSPYSLFPGPYPRSLLSFSLCFPGAVEAPASAEGARVLYYGSIRTCLGLSVCLGLCSSCLPACVRVCV